MSTAVMSMAVVPENEAEAVHGVMVRKGAEDGSVITAEEDGGYTNRIYGRYVSAAAFTLAMQSQEQFEEAVLMSARSMWNAAKEQGFVR